MTVRSRSSYSFSSIDYIVLFDIARSKYQHPSVQPVRQVLVTWCLGKYGHRGQQSTWSSVVAKPLSARSRPKIRCGPAGGKPKRNLDDGVLGAGAGSPVPAAAHDLLLGKLTQKRASRLIKVQPCGAKIICLWSNRTPIYPFWTEDVLASPVNLIITIWNVEEPVH